VKRSFLALMLCGVLLGASGASSASASDPPSAAPIHGKWERLSPDFYEPAPENSLHEVRVFHRAGDEWVSTFKHQHDPFLGTLTPPDMKGSLGDFRGVEVDVSTVDCWPGACPADMTFALSGYSTFGRLTDDPIVAPTYFVTTESGMAWWIVYWDYTPDFVVRASCPWYRDFDAAVAANPDFGWDCIEGVDEPIGGPIDFEFFPAEKNCTDIYDNDGDGLIDGADSDCSL
jgi:hypothetical protein